MAFEDGLAELVKDDPVAVLTELGSAKDALARLEKDRVELAQKVAGLEWLSSLVNGSASSGAGSGWTLHRAMEEILKTAPQRRMLPRQLAEEITRKGFYRMRDGRPVEPQQIHARARNYPQTFGRDDSFVTLL